VIYAFALLAAAQASPAFDCRAELERVAAVARGEVYEAVEGPYEVGPGDLRVHAVVMEGNGHRIVEHRCEDGRVVSRSWTESMESDEDAPWNSDSLERIAAEIGRPRAE
jgi:hypothetical protein